jgi:hypothetical protein
VSCGVQTHLDAARTHFVWVLLCRCPLQAQNLHNMSQSVSGHHCIFFFSKKRCIGPRADKGKKRENCTSCNTH